jgi:hypothetical protein
MGRRGEEDIPKPIRNPNLTDAEREQQRLDRLAAVEARLKKQGATTQAKKKKPDASEPLRGPNTEPLMKWNL